MLAEQGKRTRMSIEEWRVLERESRDVKHEYIDGYAYAMAGGTETHARIAINAVAALDAALSDVPCMVYASDMPVRLSESRYTYPDVTVSCEGAGTTSREKTELAAPKVVFEVLSQSTEHYDRTHKTAYYRSCESLQEYVLVNTEVQLVEVYRRTNEGWGVFRMYGPRDEVELTSVDVRLPVSTLYRRTDVPEMLPI